jgi:hypothetical protein
VFADLCLAGVFGCVAVTFVLSMLLFPMFARAAPSTLSVAPSLPPSPSLSCQAVDQKTSLETRRQQPAKECTFSPVITKR